jgi:hypothetical protein
MSAIYVCLFVLIESKKDLLFAIFIDQRALEITGTRQNRSSSGLIKPSLPPGSTGSVDAPVGFSNAVNHLYIGREMALNSRLVREMFLLIGMCNVLLSYHLLVKRSRFSGL